MSKADELESVVRGYMACALWTGVEYPDGHEMSGRDKDYSATPDELTEDAAKEMRDDCAAFLEAMRATIDAAEATGLCKYGPDCADLWERAGHDFWLTRNHHGAGFWDGDWPEPMATVLDDYSKAAGECDLYRDDSGMVGVA